MMSATMTFKCPCCGGYLEFDPTQQKFKCLYCGQVLSEADQIDQSEQRQAEAEKANAEETVSQEGQSSAEGQYCAPISARCAALKS